MKDSMLTQTAPNRQTANEIIALLADRKDVQADKQLDYSDGSYFLVLTSATLSESELSELLDETYANLFDTAR